MKALSIRQPWAWAILHAGKTVENRSRPTRHRGPLLIHASKSRRTSDAWPSAEWRKRFGIERPPRAELPTGALVGVVEVVACLPLAEWKAWHADGDPRATHPEAMTSPWAEGPWCWVLAEPRAFEKPVPWKGQQNLFEVRKVSESPTRETTSSPT